MRLALALCALALSACAAEDPAAAAARGWAVCNAGGGDQETLAACEAVISGEPSLERRVAALIMRGRVRHEQAQHVRAIADFGRALRLDPANADAFFHRGVSHYERGAFDAAERDFEAALAADPNYRQAAQWRGYMGRAREDNYNARMVQITGLIEQRPNDAALRNNRCWLRVTAGRELDQALADCNEAVRLEPDNQNALDSRGLVHYKLGQYDAALADYDAALKGDPERGHYLFGRALALSALGRSEDAQAVFDAAEAAEPGIAALYATYGAPRV